MTASECLRVAIGSSSCLFCQGNAQFIFVSMILIYFAVTHSHARRCSVHHCWSGRVESLLFDHVCVCVALKLLSFGRFTCGFGFGCLHRIFAKSNSNIHSSNRMSLPCPKPQCIQCVAMLHNVQSVEWAWAPSRRMDKLCRINLLNWNNLNVRWTSDCPENKHYWISNSVAAECLVGGQRWKCILASDE